MILTTVEVVCDCCGRTGPSSASGADVMTQAENHGWLDKTWHGDPVDLCPRCADCTPTHHTKTT